MLFIIGVGAGARAGIGAGMGTAGQSKCVSLSLGLYVDSAGCVFVIKTGSKYVGDIGTCGHLAS
jgi:hypothetical protein